MFFRVPGRTDAEIGFAAILDIFFQVNAVAHVVYLPQQVYRIGMTVSFRFKVGFVFGSIPAQHQHVVDTKKAQVDQGVFRIAFAEAAADQVGDRIHIVMILQGRTDSHRTRPLAHFHLFKSAVRLFLEHGFAAVVGHIDEGGLKLHQRVKMVVNTVNGFAFERGKNFKGNQRFTGLRNVVGYFHDWLNWLQTYLSAHKTQIFIQVYVAGMPYFWHKRPLLELVIHTRNLVKRYGSRTVVNNVSFNVRQGEIVGLLGPNGAGKTTSFYQVVGLVKPDEGEVFLNDLNITKLPMYKRAQLGIGYLPQEASVFRKLSVEDNISAVLEMTTLTKAEQKARLEALLDEFRLQLVRKNNGDTLSGGERRRTEIARALAVDPKFVLLDEPFAGVDPIAVEDIQSIVARLKFKNIGILITDHNVHETLSICDRAYLLIDGKIFEHGTAEELAANEQVRRLYLGRNFELRRKDYLHEEARTTPN